jgi:radical SAM-linked protein
MRLKITFAKTDHMRYTGHLDLYHTWERTVRRARLPLAYSQGFNPRPKINLAAALPLGFTSSCELVEIWLDGDPFPEEVESRLREAAPPGIEISRIESVDPKGPKLPNLIQSAVYEVNLLEPCHDLAMRISNISDSEKIIRERRGKEYDLRPLIEEISFSPEEKPELHLQLAARPGATGRPEEVLAVLGIPIYNARVHRTNLILQPPES